MQYFPPRTVLGDVDAVREEHHGRAVGARARLLRVHHRLRHASLIPQASRHDSPIHTTAPRHAGHIRFLLAI
eukprot:1919648-Rhodomonas_salina.1